MEINIAYLYYDLLNLYGENGNILSLKKHIESQDIKVNIYYLSLNDKKDFSKYDLVYIGSGTDNNLLIALNDLKNYKDEIKKYIENNKFILSTGNSFELFGNYIFKDNKKINTLGVLDYYTSYKENRIVKDVLYNCKINKNKIIGFENHRGFITNNLDYFLSDKNIKEGIMYKGFIGTYVLGPILIRNPYFTEHYIKTIINTKYNKFKFKKFNFNLEKEAYKKATELFK